MRCLPDRDGSAEGERRYSASERNRHWSWNRAVDVGDESSGGTGWVWTLLPRHMLQDPFDYPRIGDIGPRNQSPSERITTTSAGASPGPSRNSPTHFACTALATALPTTFVALRPMSRN